MNISYENGKAHLSSGHWHLNVTRKHGSVRLASLVPEEPEPFEFLPVGANTANLLVAECHLVEEKEFGNLTYQKYRYHNQKEVQT